MVNVLLVGKGAPERGGIPTYLAQIEASSWEDHQIRFLNLSHEGEREGGQLTFGNVSRTLRDLRSIARGEVSGAGSSHPMDPDDGAIDVVHIHSALAPLSTLVRAGAMCAVARSRGRRVILHAHGGRLVSWAEGGRRKRLLRWAVRWAHEILVVSAGLERTMQSAAVEPPVELLTNGVDTTRFAPAPSDQANEVPVVFFVGHLSERKGVHDLLAASQRLLDQGIEHRLVLAGGVPDEGEGEVDPRTDAPASATFLGAVEPDDMPDLYRQADVFCLPSWWEATPLSVLEAMASGLPVVATDVGDVQVMVGDAGSVVSVRAPEALADALRPLLSDAGRRAQIGTIARSRVLAHHDLGAVHRRLGEIYGEIGRAERNEVDQPAADPPDERTG